MSRYVMPDSILCTYGIILLKLYTILREPNHSKHGSGYIGVLMNHYSSNWPSETAKIMNREISNNFNPINMLQIPIWSHPRHLNHTWTYRCWHNGRRWKVVSPCFFSGWVPDEKERVCQVCPPRRTNKKIKIKNKNKKKGGKEEENRKTERGGPRWKMKLVTFEQKQWVPAGTIPVWVM